MQPNVQLGCTFAEVWAPSPSPASAAVRSHLAATVRPRSHRPPPFSAALHPQAPGGESCSNVLGAGVAPSPDFPEKGRTGLPAAIPGPWGLPLGMGQGSRVPGPRIASQGLAPRWGVGGAPPPSSRAPRHDSSPPVGRALCALSRCLAVAHQSRAQPPPSPWRRGRVPWRT